MPTLKNKKKPEGFALRLPKSLKDQLEKEASAEGLSLNTYIIYTLGTRKKPPKPA